MDIIWKGGSSVELKKKASTALLNPDKKANLKGANVVVYSSTDAKHQGKEEGIMVDWPGEYDVSGFSFLGVEHHGKKKSQIAYRFQFQAGNVVWFSEFDEYPEDKLIEALGEVHVLIIPVGGGDVFDAKTAFKLVEELEPMVVIPICYGGDREDLTKFLKEMDVKRPDPVKSYTLKRSALDTGKMELVLLKED